MADRSFSGLLKGRFDGAVSDETSMKARVKRTRIDARTVGYPHPSSENKVIWMGMTPVGESGDKWRVVEVEEEFNTRLIHVDENERLLDINRGDPEAPDLTFAEAVSRLATWEYHNLQLGKVPVDGHTVADLGHIYFKELTKRRNLLVSTVGEVVDSPNGFIPRDGRYFLKSDLEAMKAYHAEMQGDDILGELFRAQEPLYINDTSIEEDITSFGELDVFDKMKFFANILVEYAKIKVDYIEEFYGNPSSKVQREELYDRLNSHGFFSEALLQDYNKLREELALYVFRFFEVDEADWDEVLDLNARWLRKELLKRPGAQETLEMLEKEVTTPFDHNEVEAFLTVSARALLYLREMITDSAQKDALEREGVYRQSDVLNLLNFLDLLEIKYQYMELAKGATVLRGTQDHKRLQDETADFRRRVEDLKANLTDAGNFSPAQEAQIDDFIKASAPVYLLDRIKKLPENLGNAYRFISDRILPRPHQLALDLGYTQGARVAAPTRRSQAEAKSRGFDPN